ncbi:hypothetical protein AB5J62_14100 [Amycolatopsis sp. cg5]|uniref:hypothetical protein n=1 Tax=Amycolatopsis sp. cg5 TaxID=3238802 RepID=UPI0035265CC1
MVSIRVTPGLNAMAGMRNVGRDPAVLVLTLDPGSLVIAAPGGPVMWPEFVRFLHQLRDGVDEMIETFDLETENKE